MNTVPVDLFMPYASRLYLYFDMMDVPEETGDFQMFLTGVNGDAFAYQGDCNVYPYPNDEECASPLVSVPSRHVYIVESSETDSFLSFDYWPDNKYWNVHWFDQYDILAEEYEYYTEYQPDLFSADFQRVGTLPGMTVGAFDIEVLGNFQEPLDLILRRQVRELPEEDGGGSGGGGGGLPSNSNYPEKVIYETEHSVLPGDVIHIPETDLFKHNITTNPSPYTGPPPAPEPAPVQEYWMDNMSTSLEIFAQNLPSDSLLSAKNVRFRIMNFDTTYNEDGLYVSEGDDVPVIHDGEYLSLPLISKRFYFGQDLLTAWSNSYMPPIQAIDLSEYFGEGDDNEFVVNKGCVKAQGQVDLHEFTYRHFYRPDPPFEDIILETNNNKIYFNDGIQGVPGAVKWFDDYLTFTLTNPEHLDHDDNSCLRLTVEQPTEQIYGAWFHLMEVTGYNEQGELVPVYTEVVPEPATLEDDPIEGGVIDFLCDYFNEDGECLY